MQVLIFGCAYERIADESCSATTLRRRRDERINAGVMEKLHEIVLDAYDKMLGLDLSDMAVDKRSIVVDASGIPLGAIAAPANRHDSPLLEQTLDTMKILGELPERLAYTSTAATTERPHASTCRSEASWRRFPRRASRPR